MIEKIGVRAIILAIIAVMLVLAIGFGVHSCDVRRSKGAQSRVEHSQAEAASNSTADAIGTVARSGEAAAASEDVTRSNEKDIRNAKGSDAAIDPAARDAGLRALCVRRAYRDDQRCKLLKPNP